MGKLKFSEGFLYIIVGVIALFLLFSILRGLDLSSINMDLSWVQTLNTVFLSILMQAFPFILIGIFVSSFLHVFIPDETLIRVFPRKMGLGVVTAVFSGVLFPVCDCAIVPVASRLIKKGVPIPVAITFMLSAPIVNPIVIASTLYAFPGQPAVALLRVCFGIMTAVSVGLFFYLFPEKQSILKNNSLDHECQCGHCAGHDHGKSDHEGVFTKVERVFRHAGTEFFDVGKYLIIGAFLSAAFQTLLPKDVLGNLQDRPALALLTMMAAAFVFSVCSTSDAFIARTFINQFSIGSIMGFMVLGPMIDIKNMLMLLSGFRKGFVIKLIAAIFIIAFVLLLLLGQR